MIHPSNSTVSSTNNHNSNWTRNRINNGEITDYRKLPLSVRHNYSGQVSYCQHTHIKLVTSDLFSRTRLSSSAVIAEHPVFQLTPSTLMKTWLGESLTTTEKYLISTAFLVRIGAITTTDKDCCGLHITDKEFAKYEQIFHELVTSVGYQIVLHPQWRLLQLRITPEVADSGTRIKHHIENLLEQIQSLLLEEGISSQLAARSTCSGGDLDDAVEHEAQLRKLLQSYTIKSYNAKLGQWAVRQLQSLSHDSISSVEIEVVQFCLNAPDGKLRDTLLKQSIDLLKTHLDFVNDDSRNKAVLVVRHLQHKLEQIYKEVETLGFITLDIDIEAGRGTGVNYSAKTKVKSELQLSLKKAIRDKQASGADNSGALARLRERIAANKGGK